MNLLSGIVNKCPVLRHQNTLSFGSRETVLYLSTCLLYLRLSGQAGYNIFVWSYCSKTRDFHLLNVSPLTGQGHLHWEDQQGGGRGQLPTGKTFCLWPSSDSFHLCLIILWDAGSKSIYKWDQQVIFRTGFPLAPIIWKLHLYRYFS